MAIQFTRLILPDGTGKTLDGEMPIHVGDKIVSHTIPGWSALNGWVAHRVETGYGGRCDYRGAWAGGDTLHVFLQPADQG